MNTDEVPTADYSAIAEYYDVARPGPADIWISSIARFGRITRDSHVLDVGCGTGRFTVRTAESHGSHLYAIDSSIEMLENAVRKDRKKSVHWILGDAHLLPFKPGSLDCAFMTMVIHHITHRESLLAEIYRVLRASGRCVIATSSHSAIKAHILRFFPGVTGIDLRRFPTIPHLRDMMRKVGFRNVRSCLVRHDEREIPVDTYLQMVRDKYISTLSLLSESTFERGFRIFEKKLRNLHGKRMRRTLLFTFVFGEK